MRAAWGLCFAIALTSSVTFAKPPKNQPPPDPPPADVETAEQLYAKLDYDKANDVATRVLKLKGLTHDQLVRATKILAITDAVLDKEDDAKDAFLTLLVYDPDYTVDQNLGPKVSGPFLEARGHYRSLPTKPGLEVAPTIRTDGGQLHVITRDPTKLAKTVKVGWRWTSSGDYTVSSLPVGEGNVEVAAAPPGRTRLDYYAQALDDRDNSVFESGSAAVPKTAFADMGPKTSGPVMTGPTTGPKGEDKKSGGVLSSPIFWIITGAVVVGGATAAFFVFRKNDDPTSATLSPQIRCGPDICK